MTHKIPIQNIYYLLCYAWNQLDQGELVDVSTSGSTELVDLFAAVLVKGTEHIARRGLARGYDPYNEEMRGVKGRIDILPTARRMLLQHGRVACQFDELTVNTLANQILKATLISLAATENISKANRCAVLSVIRDLKGIDNIRITQTCFRRVQLGANTRFYRFLLNVCELVNTSSLPDQTSGSRRFRDFLRDEKKMPYLFQQFVYNFLRIERCDLNVVRENINWCASSVTDPKLSLLPLMQTDISIKCGERTVIIDTKYYQDTFGEYYGSKKLHSDNLYQLVGYMGNLKYASGVDVRGMLLYPFSGDGVNQQYVIQGMPVRILTIDLSQSWEKLRAELLVLPESAGAA